MPTKQKKPKQPLYYDRADQIPPYTSYGWRRLSDNEKLRGTDLVTASNNPVHFGESDSSITGCELTPFGGFYTVQKLTPHAIGKTPETPWFVYLRPWFPNRNPLLPKKDKPQP